MATAISLSIYLLRPGKEVDYDRGIGDDRTLRAPLAAPLDGYFSPLPSRARAPTWLGPVQALAPSADTATLEAQSPAGLIFVRHGGRCFVLTFGHAWIKLKPEWLERDFGRRVALNSIDADALIELKTEQVFAQWHIASERAPTGSDVETFGVEFDRDLVAAVEGLSSDTRLGKTVRGATSLRIVADIQQLPAILATSLSKFRSKAYQQRWPDIDNLSPVSDAIVVGKLEKALDADLAAGMGAKRIVLFTPSQRRGEPLNPAAYVVGRFHKQAANTPYLTFGAWEAYSKRKGTPMTIAGARAVPVHLIDESGDEIGNHSIFECLGYETSLGGKPHILSSGTWYEAIPDFVNRTNRTVRQISAPKKALPSWNGTDHEGPYNEKCAALDSTLFHFDAKNVMYGGGKSRFEVCDLMHLTSRTLYFVKVPTRSTGLSHLIEQARRTVELFFGPDPAFRSALARKMKKDDPNADTSWTTTRPQPSNWNLCFVSMGKDAIDLPFFARCSLANAYRNLRTAGHRVHFLKV